MKRVIILLGILFYCFSNSFAQTNSKTFKWSDTTFEVGSERLIVIYWSLDYSGMQPESKLVCDTVVAFMKKNQNLQIGIYCNTDQQGDYTHNMKLSNARAQSITNYCIYKGVDSARITPKGWGYQRPIVHLSEIKKLKTKQERDSAYQINRRTEVVILKTDYKK